jgi:xylulokinase
VSAESAADPADRGWQDVLIALDVGTSRQWRSAAVAALRELVAGLGPGRRVHAIGLTGQCPSVVLVDSDHRPVSPGLIYRDNRATAEATRIRAAIGERELHRRTGHRAAAFHVAPKLMWLRDHEPDAWARGRFVLQPRDWVALALTGAVITDGSHAAATLGYDLAKRAWAGDLLEAFGIPMEWLPPVHPSAGVVGTLRPGVAGRVGLPATTPIVLGGADSQACALGAGVVAGGAVSEMAGSSTCLNAVVTRPLDVLDVTHYPHVVGDDLTTETGLNTTGAALAWWVDLAYGGRRGRTTGADYERLDREAGLARAAEDGVLALAVLGDGERTDPDLRGAVVGLSLRHDRAVVARALLEGVAFAIRAQLDLLVAGGASVTELRISGGDARIATWNRIKADITGLPVRTVPGDAAVTGVAMLAGLGVGLYRDVPDAVRRCVRLSEPVQPEPAAVARYADVAGRYRALAGSAVVRAGRSGGT